MRVHRYARGTYLEPEEVAYPNGRMARRGRALWPDGKIRRVWAGLPDTFYSIRAFGYMRRKYVKGFLTVDDDGVLVFHFDEPA